MSDYDDGAYCDFCRSTLGSQWKHGGHEDWCPIVEIERLCAANAKLHGALTTVLYDLDHAGISISDEVLKEAEDALGDE